MSTANPVIDPKAMALSSAQVNRLSEFITSQLSGYNQNKERQQFWTYYGNSNPARFSQRIFAENTNNSAAHGFVFLQDAAFYNFVDEMVMLDTNISCALALAVSDICGREESFTADDDSSDDMIEACNHFLLNAEIEFGWEMLKYSLLMGRMVHGFSCVEIVWKLAYWKGRQWVVPSAFLHRHPGQFAFSSLGEPLIYIPGEVEGTPVDYGKFALMRAPAMYGNPFGHSDVYDLRNLYWFKKEAMKAWIIYCDTYGFPLLKGTIGADGTMVTEVDSYVQQLTNMIQNAQAQAGVVLLPGMDITAVARDAGMGDSPHARLTDWVNREETRTLLGATLNTMEGEHASRAQAQVMGNTTNTRMKPMTVSLRNVLQKDVVSVFCSFNFGARKAPMLKTKLDDGTSLEQALRVVETAQRMGYKISERHLQESFPQQLTPPRPGDTTLEPLAGVPFGPGHEGQLPPPAAGAKSRAAGKEMDGTRGTVPNTTNANAFGGGK